MSTYPQEATPNLQQTRHSQSPTNSTDYRILKKLRDEKKITPQQFNDMRNPHPRWPQLYGQPKIHRPSAPIRPVVSFYNTPLHALHKVLATYLKPLAQNPLCLKDSSDFKQRLDASLNPPPYTYHSSLDVKSLYTSCDMRLATRSAISTYLREEPPPPPSQPYLHHHWNSHHLLPGQLLP